jgi:hypothetical protein
VPKREAGLGTSGNIVANGAPPLNFRPLLCSNG